MYLRIFIVRVIVPVTLRARSKMCHVAVCDSASEIRSDKSKSYAGATNWGVNDKRPNLRHFTGNSGLKEIPSDPSNVSEVTELFFRYTFSKFYVKRLFVLPTKSGKNMANVTRC
jgi:hypothetical protein